MTSNSRKRNRLNAVTNPNDLLNYGAANSKLHQLLPDSPIFTDTQGNVIDALGNQVNNDNTSATKASAGEGLPQNEAGSSSLPFNPEIPYGTAGARATTDQYQGFGDTGTSDILTPEERQNAQNGLSYGIGAGITNAPQATSNTAAQSTGQITDQQIINSQAIGQVGSAIANTADVNARLNDVQGVGISNAIDRGILGGSGAALSAAAFAATTATAVGTIIPAGIFVGALGGYLSATETAKKAQARQTTNEYTNNFNQASSRLKTAIQMVNSGYGLQSDHIEEFNRALHEIDQAEANLKYQSKVSPDSWSKNRQSIDAISSFNSQGGQRDLMIAQMKKAVFRPDPTTITADPIQIKIATDSIENG